MKSKIFNKKLDALPVWQFAILMFIMVMVWAMAFPFIKIGLRELSFINLTIMRFFIVSLVFIILFLVKSRWFSKLYKKDIVPIFLLGFIGVIVYHLGLNYGEQFVSAGAASLIIATIPVFIVILAVFFLKEKITWKKLFGVFLSLVGVLVISSWGKAESSIKIDYIFGAFAVLIAAIAGAFYTVSGKKLLKRYSAFSLTVYAMLLGSLGLLPFVRISLFDEVLSMSIDGWFAILFLGIFSTVIGYVLWYSALRLKNASEIGVYLYAIPLVSTIVSYFWFDDKITPLFILGGTLVILGVAVVNRTRDKKID